MLQETAVSHCWVALLTNSHYRLLQEVDNVISEYDLGQYNDEGSDLDAILDNGTLSGVSSRYVRQVSHCKSSDSLTTRPRICSSQCSSGQGVSLGRPTNCRSGI